MINANPPTRGIPMKKISKSDESKQFLFFVKTYYLCFVCNFFFDILCACRCFDILYMKILCIIDKFYLDVVLVMVFLFDLFSFEKLCFFQPRVLGFLNDCGGGVSMEVYRFDFVRLWFAYVCICTHNYMNR